MGLDDIKEVVRKIIGKKGSEARARVIKAKDLEEKGFDGAKVSEIVKSKDLGVSRVRDIENDVELESERKGDVAYYVLEGEAECVIDKVKYRLKKGDLVFYPKGTKHKSLRGAILLEISSPPFDRGKRVYVEESGKKGTWSWILFAIAISLRLTAMFPLPFLNWIYELNPYFLILPQVFLPPVLYIVGLILGISQCRTKKTIGAYVGIALNIIGLILSFFYFSVVCNLNQECVVWFFKMSVALL